MKRRVTVLFPIPWLPSDGAERQLLELVKGLNKASFRPIVLTLYPGGALEQEFKKVPGVRVISLRRRGKYDFLVLLKIFTVLRRMKVDVVQPFVTPATFFGLLPALVCRTPVKIATERSGPGRKNSTGLGYRLYLWVEALLAQFADWAVANSEAGKQYLIQRGIDRQLVEVIYNGINLRRLGANEEKVQEVRHQLNLPQRGKVVGMMGSLFPVKNHAVFLQAAAMISQTVPDTRFALVGDGPLRSQLEKMSHDLGLESKVAFFGNQRDVGTYLSAFDVAVLTSDTEGCSNFLLEAMALGKPVVATDVGGNRELVCHRETGLIVPPRDAEAVAEVVISLLKNPDVAESMGRRARDRVIAQFSLEVMVQQYQALYEEGLRRKDERKKSSPAGRRAAQELLLLCATAKVSPAAKERMTQLLDGPMDWGYLMRLAGFHGVVPLLAHNLDVNDISSRVPQPHLNRLKQGYHTTLYRNITYSTEMERMLSVFSQRGIKAIEVKGLLLAESLYGNLGLRTMFDIDLLVPGQDFSSAKACLAEEGYRDVGCRHSFHATYLKEGTYTLEIELHWALADDRFATFPDHQLWHRAQPMLLHGVSTLTLSPEDNLLFLSYHLTKHNDHLLKLLCDIAELLKKYEGSLDWDYIRESACSWQIQYAVHYSLRRAQDLLGAPVPASLLEAIKPGAVRWWLLDLLVNPQNFIAPLKWTRLRNETRLLNQTLMMKRLRQMLVVLHWRHSQPGMRGIWLRIVAWIALTFIAALGRYGARAASRPNFKLG